MPIVLPYDIARCPTDGCPLAATCRRKEPGREGYQVYSMFPGGFDCHGYWPAGEKD